MVLLIRLSVLGRPFLPPPALEAGVVENGAAAREADALGVARGRGEVEVVGARREVLHGRRGI